MFDPDAFDDDDPQDQDDPEDPFRAFINDDLNLDDLAQPPFFGSPFASRPQTPDTPEERPFESRPRTPGGKLPDDTPPFGPRPSTLGSLYSRSGLSSPRSSSNTPFSRPFSGRYGLPPSASDPRWRLGSYTVSEPVPVILRPDSSLSASTALMPRRGWFRRLVYYIPEATPGWTAVRVGRFTGYVDADQVQFTPYRWTGLVELVEWVKQALTPSDRTPIILLVLIAIMLYLLLLMQSQHLGRLEAQLTELQATLSAPAP